MANARHVQKNVRRLVSRSKTGRIVAGSTDELKKHVGADDMRTLCFQEILADLKHQNVLRGFSLGGEEVYIQG